MHRIEADPPAAAAALEPAARIAHRLDVSDFDLAGALALQQPRLLPDRGAGASRVNRHLYVLCVATALLLPPSVAAGIFGIHLAARRWLEVRPAFWPPCC